VFDSNVIPAQAGIQYVIDSGRIQISGLPPSRERREFFNSLLGVAVLMPFQLFVNNPFNPADPDVAGRRTDHAWRIKLERH
jgi:hypothetical protein